MTRRTIPPVAWLLLLLAAPASGWAQAGPEPGDGADAAGAPDMPAGADSDAQLQLQLREARQRLEQALGDIRQLGERMAGQFADGPFPLPGALTDRLWFSPAGEARAVLGVTVAAPGDERAGDGALVTRVAPGGPADEAGVQVGDLIVALNGESLARAGEAADLRLIERMREVQPGEAVVLGLRRDGRSLELEVVAREAAPPTIASGLAEQGRVLLLGPGEVAPSSGGWRGVRPFPPVWQSWSDMQLVELSPELGAYFSAEHGLLVVRAPRDRVLALRDGDVIQAIGGRRPVDAGHAMRILGSYEAGEVLQLQIVREHRAETLEIELPERRTAGMRRLLLEASGSAPGDAPSSDRGQRPDTD